MNTHKHIVLLSLIGGFCFFTSINLSHAQIPEAEAASAALEVAPIVGQMLKDISAIPISSGNIVRLPMGVLEVFLSPLPEITFLDGLTNIGKGLKAPFDLIINTLALPGRTAGSVADLIKLSSSSISPSDL